MISVVENNQQVYFIFSTFFLWKSNVFFNGCYGYDNIREAMIVLMTMMMTNNHDDDDDDNDDNWR